MYYEHYSLVKDFNAAVGHYPVPHTDIERTAGRELADITDPDYNLYQINQAAADLAINLIIEETTELREAYYQNDTYEFIDGICDTLYVVYGAILKYRFELPEYDYPQDYEGGSGMFGKPIDLDILIDSGSQIGNDILILQSLVTLLDIQHANKDVEGLEKTLQGILITCYRLGIWIETDIDVVFDEVHRSNMTKISPTEAQANEHNTAGYRVAKRTFKTSHRELYSDFEITECKREEVGEEELGASEEEVIVTCWVLYDENGKVKKPHRFERPQLRAALDALLYEDDEYADNSPVRDL